MPRDFHQLTWDAAIEDDLRQLVRLAVREDLDRQYDWTTVALIGPEEQGRAAVVVREPGVVAGLRALTVVIDEMNAAIRCNPCANDGDAVPAGTVVAELGGSARDMLTCERTLLNMVGRLSGIATLSREYVRRVEGTGARIYDTRKTTPGWRRLEKYAVRCGGGFNHRTGLFDAILIKDNHIALRNIAPASGRAVSAPGLNRSAADVVRTVRTFISRMTPHDFPGVDIDSLVVEVEIDDLAQLDEVLAASPDIVLLDNLSSDAMHTAVARRNELAPQVALEASGGVTLDTVRQTALSGVERISVGALTHSARSLDVALDWLPSAEGT